MSEIVVDRSDYCNVKSDLKFIKKDTDDMSELNSGKEVFLRNIYLKDMIDIPSFVNASRVDIDKNYVFDGEMHNLWEMQYMADGSAYVAVSDGFYELKRGEVSFYRPNQFHVVYGNGQSCAQMWVFSFYCESPMIRKLENSIVNASEECERLMESILFEVSRSFEYNLDDENSGYILKKKRHTPLGSAQIIKNRLEELIILLMREKNRPFSVKRYDREKNTVNACEIREMLVRNIHSKLSIADISREFNISPTYLKQIYRKEFSVGIISDFNLMKAKYAANLLESADLSISETAAAMGFDNVYSFSSFFKKHIGESPTQYRKRKLNPNSNKD